jgi:alpha-galactosidase
MGFEMDPRELDGTERAVLREVTDWWKDNRDWLMRADILRLDSADPAVTAEQQLAADGARFVVFAGRMAASRQIAPRPLRLAGLDPHARYRIHLRNRAAAPALSRGEQRLKREDVTLTGTALMRQGLTLPWHFPQTIWVIEGKKL